MTLFTAIPATPNTPHSTFLFMSPFRSFCELGAISKTAHSACLPHKSLGICDAGRLNLTKMPRKIAIIGVGLVGRGWSIVFARAGFQVALFDSDRAAVARAPALIRQSLDKIHRSVWNPDTVVDPIPPAETLEQALEDAEYAQ